MKDHQIVAMRRAALLSYLAQKETLEEIDYLFGGNYQSSGDMENDLNDLKTLNFLVENEQGELEITEKARKFFRVKPGWARNCRRLLSLYYP